MLLENKIDPEIRIRIITKAETCESVLLLYYHAYKGRLLNGLIHNIGSPLQSVMFLFEFLETKNFGGGDKELREIVDSQLTVVSRELQGVAETFENFRILERMVESYERTLNLPDFLRLFSKVLWTDLFFKHNVKLSIKSDLHFIVPDMPSRIICLIFVEIVRNALKALKRTEGSRKLEFVLNVADDRNKVVIKVGDSGCGWSLDTDTSALFQPYHSRWDPLDVSEIEIPSFGLGLHCVRELISFYGGEISLSRYDDMTWVTLVLPFSGECI